MENQIYRKIRVFRSYNGGEYTSVEMKAFCGSVGIKRELSVPYNPSREEE